jgi:hypothetical protein
MIILQEINPGSGRKEIEEQRGPGFKGSRVQARVWTGSFT